MDFHVLIVYKETSANIHSGFSIGFFFTVKSVLLIVEIFRLLCNFACHDLTM